MSSERYRIQFEGGIADGFSPPQVKQAVQTLFRISSDRTERLFDGSVRILKTDLSIDDANRYRDRLLKAGAVVRVVPVPGETIRAAAEAPAASAQPSHATSLSELSVVPIEGETAGDESAAEAGDGLAAAMQQSGDEQPAATAGPARFEAKPVGSTPIKRPAQKPLDPEDIREAPFQFVGKGSEYFGIWIVNILLTIVTLGIYSAWATVRNNQYFYGNTRLDDASFQYLANPVTILKGRIIAFVAFIAYGVISELYPLVGVALGIAFLFAIPWIVIRSLRFKAINSAYRNVRFDFEASYADALMAMVVWPAVNLFTLFLLTPFAVLKTHRFIGNGARYGTARFGLDNTNREYYAFFGKGLLMGIGFGVASYVVGALTNHVLSLIVLMVGYLAVIGYFMAGLTNLFLSGLTLKEHSFHSVLDPRQMVWIFFSNSILVALTLGLFTPWAKVRMARYRASCTEMVIAGDLDGFVSAENRRTSAIGQELGDAFDVGIVAF